MEEQQKKEIRIPQDEAVKQAISSAIRKSGFIKSQEELAHLTREELRQKFPEAMLSPQRARLLATELPTIEVRVLTKKSSASHPKQCPACKRKLKGLYAKNLLNKKVLIGLACERCRYRGMLKTFAPFRYEFTLIKR